MNTCTCCPSVRCPEGAALRVLGATGGGDAAMGGEEQRVERPEGVRAEEQEDWEQGEEGRRGGDGDVSSRRRQCRRLSGVLQWGLGATPAELMPLGAS